MEKAATPIYLLDGGLGTTLQDEYRVEVDGTLRPLWSSHLLISDPAKLLEVQTAFDTAGADILLTATYQASFSGFSRTPHPQTGELGIAPQDAELYMRSAVAIARAAFKGREDGKVALSLGAYGATMVPSQEYTGRYDELHRSVQQLSEWHNQRLDVFASDKDSWDTVDLVAFETVPLLAEIEAARETMVRTAVTNGGGSPKPFWISCVFPGDDLCLPDGSPVAVAVRTMLESNDRPRPNAIGLNCTKIAKVPALLDEFEKAVRALIEEGEMSRFPSLIFYPDGTRGEVYNTSTREWEMKAGDGELASCWEENIFEIVRLTRERGLWEAIYVGGCCKTTPRMIMGLKKRIMSL